MNGVGKNILNMLSDDNFEKNIRSFTPEIEPVISNKRIRHMHSVAELMYKFADTFKCSVLTPEELYFLGLNHDIGYLYGKENHEENGTEFFSKDGFMKKCIRWHGSTPAEYKEYYGCNDFDIPHELILLWWADLMVESSGDNAGVVVGFDERLNSISERFGRESKTYQSCNEKAEWLISYIADMIILS